MAARQITVVVGARDDLSRVLSRVGLNLNQLRAGFHTATRGALVLGAAVGAVGGALTAIAITTAKAGDEFQKMALRTGVSVEALSELRHAAELSGSSIEDIESGFRKLSKTMLDADNGLSTAVRTFDRLGLSTKDSYGQLKSADVVFMESVDALNSLTSATEQSALAQELFGKSGTKLLPLIKSGKVGIAEMREEAHKLGITFSQVESDQAAAFNDEMDRTKKALLGVKNAIGKDLLPAFTRMLEQITNFITTSPGLHSAIEKTTRLFKNLAETMGFDVLTPLEKLNREIDFMQNAPEAFDLFDNAADYNEELNRLLGERVRLIALEAHTSSKAEREKASAAAREIARQREAALTGDAEQGPFNAQLEAYRQYQAAKLAEADAAYQKELEFEEMSFQRYRAYIDAKNALDQERLITASKVAGGTVDFANNMYTILGSKGKAFAKVAKGLAITQAIIDGKTAAVAAWSAGMKAQPQGWWSPIVAAGFVASSLAQTGALISSIGGSQGGGGGGIGGEGTVRTAPGGGFDTDYPAPSAEKAAPPLNVTLNVQALDPSQIQWDKLMEDNIAPALERLSGQRGTELNINVVRR